MPFAIIKPGSADYEHVRYLIAMWCKPGIAFLGGHRGNAPQAEFCLLLNADPGTDDKTLQLNADSGTDTHCLELNTSTV